MKRGHPRPVVLSHDGKAGLVRLHFGRDGPHEARKQIALGE